MGGVVLIHDPAIASPVDGGVAPCPGYSRMRPSRTASRYRSTLLEVSLPDQRVLGPSPLQVGGGRARADPNNPRDAVELHSRRVEGEHPLLDRRECRAPRAGQDERGYFRTRPRPIVHHLGDRLHQGLGRLALAHESGDTGIEHRCDRACVGQRRHHEHPAPGRLDPTREHGVGDPLAEVEIEEQDVGEGIEVEDRFGIDSLVDDCRPEVALHHSRQPAADQGVVVDDRDPHARSSHVVSARISSPARVTVQP